MRRKITRKVLKLCLIFFIGFSVFSVAGSFILADNLYAKIKGGIPMKGFKCGVCGYVAIDGKAPENCPVCGAPKKMFSESQIKTPKDVATIGESEKKHIPVIAINKVCGLIPGSGCTDVNIKIGEITHPMLAEHYILHIDFYIDRKFVSRQIFTPEKVNPASCLHVKVPKGKLSVVEMCNVHGDWINETDF